MNQCIHCDQPAFTRGVCRTHYSRYDRAKRLAPDADAFDELAVAAGLILACGEARRRKINCEFDALLKGTTS